MNNKTQNKFLKQSNDSICSINDCRVYLVETFNSFAKFCEDFKITCFLMWGTLLGAIRDGHIIPWDDDIDLAITEDNYEKLKNNIEKLNDYGLSYYHYSTHKDTYSNEIRIYKKGFYQILQDDHSEYITPVCIDIFVARKISKTISSKKLTKVNKKLRRAYSLLIKKEVKWKTQNFFKRFAKKIYRIIVSFIPNGTLHNKIDKLSQSLYAGGDYNYFFPDTLYHVDIKQYDKTFFETLKIVPFENTKFFAPTNSDELLTKIYGDWKKPSDRSDGKIYNKKFLKRF